MDKNRMIIVAGAARSYTSVTAGILYHGGAWGGKDDKSLDIGEDRDEQNYENLSLVGYFYSAAKKLREMEKVVLPKTIATCLQAMGPDIVASHGAPKGAPVVVKHPRIVSHDGISQWNMWDIAFPDAKWVIVRRPVDEILRSHSKKYGKVDYDTANVLQQLAVMKSYFEDKGKDHFEIWPGEAMKDPDYPEFKELVEWADLEWNEAIEDHIQPA